MPSSIETLSDQVAAVGATIDEVMRTVATTAEPAAQVDPRLRTDDRLRALLVGLERVRNSAEAAQAAVMMAMGDEARQLDAAEFAASGLPSRSHEEFVPDEISVLLACTKTAAGRRYALALRAVTQPIVEEAWLLGQIDARKAEVITDELTALSDPEFAAGLSARDVHDIAGNLARVGVEHALTHTWSETRAWLRRRVIKVAPDVAELRRGRAEQQRRVQITPSDDGMSELWAWLPSVDARQIQQALTTAAHNLGATDGRTMDQRRADLMVQWLLGPEYAPTVHLHLIAEPSARADVGGANIDMKDDVGAWLPGVGALTELQSSELIGSAHKVIVASPVEFQAEEAYRPSSALERAVRTRDVTCRFPGCRRSALGTGSGTDVDHTVAWPAGSTVASNLAVLCRRHHRLKHSPGWRVMLSPDGVMTWTTPTARTYTSEPWHHSALALEAGPMVHGPEPPARE